MGTNAILRAEEQGVEGEQGVRARAGLSEAAPPRRRRRQRRDSADGDAAAGAIKCDPPTLGHGQGLALLVAGCCGLGGGGCYEPGGEKMWRRGGGRGRMGKEKEKGVGNVGSAGHEREAEMEAREGNLMRRIEKLME